MKKIVISVLAIALVVSAMVISAFAAEQVPSIGEYVPEPEQDVVINDTPVQATVDVNVTEQEIAALEEEVKADFEAAYDELGSNAPLSQILPEDVVEQIASTPAEADTFKIATVFNLDIEIPEGREQGKSITVSVNVGYGYASVKVIYKKYNEATIPAPANLASEDGFEWEYAESSYEDGVLTFTVPDNFAIGTVAVLVDDPIIPDTSDTSKGPQTGDSSASTAAVIVLAVSAGAAACVFAAKRKHNA